MRFFVCVSVCTHTHIYIIYTYYVDYTIINTQKFVRKILKIVLYQKWTDLAD